MCGITGIVDNQSKFSAEELQETVNRMNDTIRHRGPDDCGIWVDANAGVALGHRRLSIIDISQMGHQPMVSNSGRYVIVFNGEIYNYKSIKNNLGKKGVMIQWRGHSDTEVFLEAIETLGLEAVLKDANGMFAFALWDREEHALILGRDRMGKKPLYYGWVGRSFVFASELKSLKVIPDFTGTIDQGALTLMLKFGTVPQPYSIYKGIYKLPPATMAIFKESVISRPEDYSPWVDGEKTHPISFWDARKWMKKTSSEELGCSEYEAIDMLEELLRDSVRLRMLSDVPVGGFLSGGLDSSAVVTFMQQQSQIPVKTFTIAYTDKQKKDAYYANLVAKHLCTDHNVMTVTPEKIKELLPKIADVMDEPNADRSQLIAFMLSKFTREKVTVALSGDGGDELFAGNQRQIGADWFYNYWMKKVGVVPDFIRSIFAFLVTKIHINKKINDFAASLPYVRPEDFFRSYYEKWWDASKVALKNDAPRSLYNDPSLWLDVDDPLARVLFLDLFGRLIDIVLPKVDRVSMKASLEVRCPFIDYRVIEFSTRIPIRMKIRDGNGKWLLKQILYRYLPKDVVDRPKQTFSMPMHEWFRGPLRDWCEWILDEKRLEEQGLMNPSLIRAKWRALLEGDISWGHQLWIVMITQAWLANDGR